MNRLTELAVKTTNRLEAIALQAIKDREASEAEKNRRHREERNQKLLEIQEGFEAAFEAELEILKEAKVGYEIKWTVGQNRQVGISFYIEWVKEDKRTFAKMDYVNPKSYRFGSVLTFGEWNKKLFLLWVYYELFRNHRSDTMMMADPFTYREVIEGK